MWHGMLKAVQVTPRGHHDAGMPHHGMGAVAPHHTLATTRGLIRPRGNTHTLAARRARTPTLCTSRPTAANGKRRCSALIAAECRTPRLAHQLRVWGEGGRMPLPRTHRNTETDSLFYVYI